MSMYIRLSDSIIVYLRVVALRHAYVNFVNAGFGGIGGGRGVNRTSLLLCASAAGSGCLSVETTLSFDPWLVIFRGLGIGRFCGLLMHTIIVTISGAINWGHVLCISYWASALILIIQITGSHVRQNFGETLSKSGNSLTRISERQLLPNMVVSLLAIHVD